MKLLKNFFLNIKSIRIKKYFDLKNNIRVVKIYKERERFFERERELFFFNGNAAKLIYKTNSYMKKIAKV